MIASRVPLIIAYETRRLGLVDFCIELKNKAKQYTNGLPPIYKKYEKNCVKDQLILLTIRFSEVLPENLHFKLEEDVSRDFRIQAQLDDFKEETYSYIARNCEY